MHRLKIERVRIQNVKIERLKMLEDSVDLKSLECPNCKSTNVSVFFRDLENDFVCYIPYCIDCHYSFENHILLSEKILKSKFKAH